MRKRSEVTATPLHKPPPTQKDRTKQEVRKLLAQYDLLRASQTALGRVFREPDDSSLTFTERGHYNVTQDLLSELLTRLFMEVQKLQCSKCADTWEEAT
jgi:hypothetical protein